MLERAEDPALQADEAERLDRQALEMLAVAKDPDALLRQLSLETLERWTERCTERLSQRAAEPGERRRELAWTVLDLLRRPAVLTRIGEEARGGWAARLLRLIDASHLTVGPLFRQRAQRYGSQVLFELDQRGRRVEWSWQRAAGRVELFGRALLALDPADEPAPVAILSENGIEMALLDLACLTAGLVNVMAPANATTADVGYILEHSGAGTVIVSGQAQLAKVLPHRDRLKRLKTLVTIDPGAAGDEGVLTLDQLSALAQRVPHSAPRQRSERVESGDLATIMYTSGTTGTPKGIKFSHRNIVFKRFARALALPEIGEQDVFLCFLPLYHTFGRFLELLGCVFWGARYCFLEDTSPKSMVQAMRRHRPTVFISVPKKWIQLHEAIAEEADPFEATDEELLAATRRITGGRLRFGLSAAGHLDSDVFRFFQRQGIELLSGFGMTEATGGITMTPPGRYEDGSLGLALPGIEICLAADKELLVRGPYVMLGYLDPPCDEPSFDADGWLHTGDLMEVTASGHLRLVDRKKEIYKNIKGETIAPQRVENMFREFDSVGRAFLVGDHRDYNTLLIHPDPDYAKTELGSRSDQEVLDHFRSLVVSVNQFLAPYERIVDFALIPRDLDAARGELTDKGTPRRKAVEQGFADVIRELYRRTNVRVGGIELILPNWLFQILGLTARDVRVGEEAIVVPSRGTRLTVKAREPGRARIGSVVYQHSEGPLNLGVLLTTPRWWLGNEELVGFVPLDTVTRQRTRQRAEGLRWIERAGPYLPQDGERRLLESCIGRADLDLLDLDLAARMMGSASAEDALLALRVMEQILDTQEVALAEPTRFLLARAAGAPFPSLRRFALGALLPGEKDSRFAGVLQRFTDRDPGLFDPETCRALAQQPLSEDKIEAFVERTRQACSGDAPAGDEDRLAAGLLNFLAIYGSAHPTAYRRIRAFLERMSLFAARERERQVAQRACEELVCGFRRWLGAAARIAVDPDRGVEYRWEDVVVFDEGLPAADRARLLSAMSGTAFIAEAIFLFSPGASVGLAGIAAGGVRVRLLGRLHGKAVYRITVQTRFQGSFDLAANLNHDMTPQQVREEIQWLILSGDPGDRRAPLVEEFGGYWPEQELWSEEFIEGETLHDAMRRLALEPRHEERLKRLWPFMAWATLAAYVDFWQRSGRRLEIGDPDMKNIIVPTQDFLSGVRIVSVSRRRRHDGLLPMLRGFREEFVRQAEGQYPFLAGTVDWPVIFSSLLEVVGEEEGLALLRDALQQAASVDPGLQAALCEYLTLVVERGFIPMRLHFAAERYRRWVGLSADATPQARAQTLQELYETYGLQRLAKTYPEIRIRFYRETVFRDCPPALDDGLRRIIRAIRDDRLPPEELIDAVDELRAERPLGADEEYFLARLSYPHLRPQDEADFVRRELGGRRQSDIVVTLDDADGSVFRVRHALNPKEVERLLRLFVAAKLDVRFRMEHQYLVAINDRSQIIGGVYYEIDEDGHSAHLEKIVAAERYRGKRVAHGLMNELINRLRAAGVKTLTTGFFRSDYFYGYGFAVNKGHAGLVKDLTLPDPAPTAR